MIQKGTYLIPMDKNGVWRVMVFHIYGGFKKKYGITGNFLKISVKKIKNSKWLTKKSKLKTILILTKSTIKKKDNSHIKFKLNSCILLKKRLSSVGQILIGPSNINIKRKRFVYSFSGTI